MGTFKQEQVDWEGLKDRLASDKDVDSEVTVVRLYRDRPDLRDTVVRVVKDAYWEAITKIFAKFDVPPRAWDKLATRLIRTYLELTRKFRRWRWLGRRNRKWREWYSDRFLYGPRRSLKQEILHFFDVALQHQDVN